jgi:hypothetical protein
MGEARSNFFFVLRSMIWHIIMAMALALILPGGGGEGQLGRGNPNEITATTPTVGP